MYSKKIIVTGGAGFIGSHLCKALLDRGHSVYAVDNLYTGSLDTIKPLIAAYQCFHFIHHDITIPLDLACDWIFNLACPASPQHYQKDPVFTLTTNVIGTLNMLNLAKKYHARFLQASTSEVYGDPHEHPQRESYHGNVNPIGIRSCYDEGKRCAETLCFDFHRMHGIDIKVIRIFNTYGPHMDPNDGRVVSNFITQALNNAPITMYGTGQQTRSFCYISDLVDGIMTMMNSDTSITGPINLGNPIEYRLIDLAHMITSLTNSLSPIVFKTLPQDDPTKRKPDILQAQTLLGWQPHITLEHGLKKTIVYFQSCTRMITQIPAPCEKKGYCKRSNT